MTSANTGVGPHYKGNTVKFEKTSATVNAKDLNIVWGEDSRYWKKPVKGDDPAELLQVCWLEVTGNVSNVPADKEYEVIFKVSLTADAFGWDTRPIYIMVKRGNDHPKWGKMSLDNKSAGDVFDIKKTVPQGGTSISFGLYEVWSGKWKGGLKIHKVVVEEPKPSSSSSNKP